MWLVLFALLAEPTAVGNDSSQTARRHRDLDEELHIYVTDRALTPPLLLHAALGRMVQILSAAGVRSSWKVCPPDSIRPGNPPCSEPGPLAIWLRILPSAETKFWTLDPNTCGRALIGTSGEHGILAVIDAGCVARRGGFRPATWSALASHVFGHEIGHLLLGREGHSSEGIMKARWQSKETMLLMTGGLDFSPADAAVLRQQVSLRALAARSAR